MACCRSLWRRDALEVVTTRFTRGWTQSGARERPRTRDSRGYRRDRFKVCAGHPRAFALTGGKAVRRTPERNCHTADQHERLPGPAPRIVVHDHPLNVRARHPRAFALIGGKAVRRTPERNCQTADRHECSPIAWPGATDRRTRPSPQRMCWSSAGIRANRR